MLLIENVESQLNNLKSRIAEWDEKNWIQRVFSKDKLTREDVENEMLLLFNEDLFVQLAEQDNIDINNKVINLFVTSKDLLAYEDYAQILLRIVALKSIQPRARKLLDEMLQLAIGKLKNMKEVERLYGLLQNR